MNKKVDLCSLLFEHLVFPNVFRLAATTEEKYDLQNPVATP